MTEQVRTLEDVFAGIPVTNIPLQDDDSGGDDDDFGVPNPEPKRRRGRPRKDETTKPRTRATKTTLPPKRKGQFVEPLTQLYTACGMMLLPMDAVCGKAIIESAEQCAKSLDELAYQNDAVRRALFALTQTTALGGVVVAHLPILMAITMHHFPTAPVGLLGGLGATTPRNPATGQPGDTGTAS